MRAPPARCANALQARLACVTAACVQDRRVRDGFCLSGLCPYVPAWPRVRASWLASRDGFSCVPAGRRQCRFQPCTRCSPAPSLAAAYYVYRRCICVAPAPLLTSSRAVHAPQSTLGSDASTTTAPAEDASPTASLSLPLLARIRHSLAALDHIALESPGASYQHHNVNEGTTSQVRQRPPSTSGVRDRRVCARSARP